MKLPQPRYTVTSDDHKYIILLPDGVRIGPLVSVTKVLEVMAKPALINWAAREAANYFKAEILRQGKNAMNAAILDRIAKDAANAHRKKARDAADIGTLLHEVFEAVILGKEPPKIPEELEAAVTAFKDYRLQSDIEVVCTELSVASLRHCYGGRLDWIGYSESRGGWGIGDNKTASGFFGVEFALQAGGGYAQAVKEQYGIEVKWAEIARFSKKPPFESEARPVTDVRASIAGFLHALGLLRTTELELIGDPLFQSVGKPALKAEKKIPKKSVGTGF